MQLDGAAESLRLFKADVLDSAALAAAVEGCEGVFHVASPVPLDKLVDPEASTHLSVPRVRRTVISSQICIIPTISWCIRGVSHNRSSMRELFN